MVGAPRKSPAELSPNWPDAASEDLAGEAARQIALVIRAETARHGVRGLAALAGVQHGTLISVSEGRSWPSVTLVVRLEHALGRSIWPTEHLAH